MTETAMIKILRALAKKNMSTQELVKELKLPIGTVRSTVCMTSQTNLTRAIPEKKRGKPFELTETGKEYLRKLEAE